MAKRILVTYASRYGSTAEVAQAIGAALSESGAQVEVCPMRSVKSLSGYAAVVLGVSIRMEKPLKEAVTFAGKHREALSALPTAVFSMGLYMRDDTPENRSKTRAILTPLLEHVPQAVAVEYFGGCLKHAQLGFLLRIMARHDSSGILQEGDWRNWEAIRAWAGHLCERFGLRPAVPG